MINIIDYPTRQNSVPDDTGEVVTTECYVNGRWVELPDNADLQEALLKIIQSDYDTISREMDQLRTIASTFIHSRELSAKAESSLKRWLTDKIISELNND